MMTALLQCLDLLYRFEATMTVAAVIIVWAIIGGPMRFMKWRYKTFMFCVALSLIGASLDKLNYLAPQGDIEVVVLAKAMIGVARFSMVLSGAYVLVMWWQQCHRIKEAAARLAKRNAVPTPEAAARRKLEDTATYTPIMG